MLKKTAIVAFGVGLGLLFYYFMSPGRYFRSKDDILSGIKVQPQLQESTKLIPSTPAVVKVRVRWGASLHGASSIQHLSNGEGEVYEEDALRRRSGYYGNEVRCYRC